MQQIIAANVAPHPRCVIRRFPSADNASSGYYTLEVPRSPQAPHAVRVGDGLRYPRRDGATTRYLAESEVADAYRHRFQTAGDQLERIAAVRTEGDTEISNVRFPVWLSIALVPDDPGELTLSTQVVARAQHGVMGIVAPNFGPQSIRSQSPDRPTTGQRRLIIRYSGSQRGRADYGVLHLHTDGSGYAGVPLGREPTKDASGSPEDVVHVNDEWLTQATMDAIAILANHAARTCGATGDAVIECSLHPARSTQPTKQMQLTQAWDPHVFDAGALGYPMRATIGPTRHAINLDEVTTSARGQIVAARLMLTDLLQAFGVAESYQFDLEGRARWKYFTSHERVRQEAARLGLELSDEEL